MSLRQRHGILRTCGFSFALAESGFRIFFLAAAVFGLLAMPCWVLRYAGLLPQPAIPGPAGHAHAMLFGYTLAVLAGFLTIRVGGARIAALFAVWAAARILLEVPGPWPTLAGLAADLLFIPVLIAVRDPPFWAVWKWPNGVFLPLLGAFWLVDLAIALDAASMMDLVASANLRAAALDLFAILLVTVAGRLIPGYTGATLRHIRPPRQAALEAASIALLGATALCHLVAFEIAAAVMLIAVGGLQGLRQWAWRPWETLRHPLLWILHLGYAWVALGLALRGIAALAPDLVPPSTALHALTVGAIGSLTIGMMTRITLNQSRQPLVADSWTQAAFVAMQAAALIRVALPIAAPVAALWAYAAAASFWSLSMAIWLVRYGMLLIKLPSGSENPVRDQPGRPSARGRTSIGA